jgi:hypothetical protein
VKSHDSSSSNSYWLILETRNLKLTPHIPKQNIFSQFFGKPAHQSTMITRWLLLATSLAMLGIVFANAGCSDDNDCAPGHVCKTATLASGKIFTYCVQASFHANIEVHLSQKTRNILMNDFPSEEPIATEPIVKVADEEETYEPEESKKKISKHTKRKNKPKKRKSLASRKND